ncbi:MAG: CPBP family glutamic-type intramembrane protease [Nostoc sp.]|uniref:CPBP family glutamic-type intramembrane protease n=1 Tax=Nostoc sp. TaxID=1180 RepID=UPI002FFC81C9
MVNQLSELSSLIKFRLINSVSTFINSNDWIWIITLFIIFSLVGIPLGFKLGLLRFEIAKISCKILLRTALITLIIPVAAEEAFFRVLLLPNKVEQASLVTNWLWGSISLILFVVYHPLNATFFIRNARATFNSFAFLTLAAILGIVCTIAYLKSGSIYPPVILHWVFVLGWLMGLGGYRRLHNQASSSD